MNTPLPRLGTVTEILQMIGLDVTHQYDDLVFVSRNPFILRFTEAAERIDLYFNENIEEEKAQELMAQMEAMGELHGLVFSYRGAYSLEENDDETLSVEFFDLADQ